MRTPDRPDSTAYKIQGAANTNKRSVIYSPTNAKVIVLLPNSATYTQQPGPANIRRHNTTELITRRCTIIILTKCNFSTHG